MSLAKAAQISAPDGAALHLCTFKLLRGQRHKWAPNPSFLSSIHPSSSVYLSHGGRGREAQTSLSPDTSSGSPGGILRSSRASPSWMIRVEPPGAPTLMAMWIIQESRARKSTSKEKCTSTSTITVLKSVDSFYFHVTDLLGCLCQSKLHSRPVRHHSHTQQFNIPAFYDSGC